MSNDLLQKFSSELKEVREKKEISIEQIFNKTRIDKKYLTAIEENNFDIMPNVYIRAFIKEYAKTIGLNSDEVLDKFSKAKEGINYFKDITEESKTESPKQENIKPNVLIDSKVENTPKPVEEKPKSNKVLIQVLIGFLLLISIFVIYKLFLTESNTEIVTEKPFDKIIYEQNNGKTSEESLVKNDERAVESNKLIQKIELKKNTEIKNKNNSNPAQKTTTIPTIAVNPNELALTIVGTAKSWIRAVVDDTDNSEFILENGITKVLRGKSKFYLHIGNSGGVKLLLNNKDIFFTGAPGKVRKIYVTKNGIEYLRRTPQINAE